MIFRLANQIKYIELGWLNLFEILSLRIPP